MACLVMSLLYTDDRWLGKQAAVAALQRALAGHAVPPASAAPPAGAPPARSLRSRVVAMLALALSRAASAARSSAPGGVSR